MFRGVFLEDLLLIFGLFGVQCVYGGYMVFLNRLLALGLSSLFIVIVACAASATVIFPFAVAFERKKWPAKLSPVLVGQLVMMSLGGVSIYQVVMMLGIERTSPATASAMPNLGPGLIFTIASCLRLEKFDWKCKYTRAKILGTLVCLSGAMSLSFFNSPDNSQKQTATGKSSYSDWILGCFYLLGGVTVYSCNTILQAATMTRFPAPLSISVITALMGSIFTALLQLILKGKLGAGTRDVDAVIIVEIVLVGGAALGLTAAFQTWGVGRKGPVFVSLFSPFQAVFSAFISMVFFRQWIGLGCLIGILLMFSGLYIVLWAKNNERTVWPGDDESPELSAPDIERPLLS